MEYVYAAMMLHKANKTIDEASLKKVLEAAGITADEGRIKALVAALEGVDIEEAIANATVATSTPAAPAGDSGAAPAAEEKKKEDKKEEKANETQAAAGLGALFG